MRSILGLAALAMPLLLACTDPGIGEETSTSDQSVTSENKIAMNKIAMNKIAMNQLAAGDLLATSEGRDVLEYLVSCSLSEGTTLVATVGDETYEFEGSLGLAKNWTERRLSRSEQRWVSSCMLARVNAFELSLLISLRGPTHALITSAEEKAQFALEEGAFYGDIFTPENEPIKAFACRGKDSAIDGSQGDLGQRVCTEQDAEVTTKTRCGFTYTGDCDDFTDLRRYHHGDDADDDRDSNSNSDHRVLAPHACEDFTWNGYYRECHEQVSDAAGRWPRRSEWDEVITVFVQNN